MQQLDPLPPVVAQIFEQFWHRAATSRKLEQITEEMTLQVLFCWGDRSRSIACDSIGCPHAAAGAVSSLTRHSDVRT